MVNPLAITTAKHLKRYFMLDIGENFCFLLVDHYSSWRWHRVTGGLPVSTCMQDVEREDLDGRH